MSAEEKMAGHIIVCGMGHVGYRVVDLLCRLGESVTVVTRPTREEWIKSAEARGVRIVMGDARDADNLIAAGLNEARALIATADQDLVNVEIALDAKKARPDLPLVVRIFDQNLAQQLEASFDVRRALAMSALAAPTFAAAALGEKVAGAFRMDDTLFLVGRRVVEESSPLNGLRVGEIGSRFRLATLLLDRGDGEVIVGPSSDTVLESGLRVTLLGDKADWDRIAEADSPVDPTGRVRSASRMAAFRSLHPFYWLRLAARIWRQTPLPLLIVFIALNTLILISVFVFHYAMNLSFVDALYFIVSTVTTTGYGDITPPQMRPGLRLYSCLVMMLGSATIATLYSIITDFIVTSRFAQLLGRRRTPHEDHFIVAGLGTVGYRIVDKLRRIGARVVAIERDSNGEFVQAVRSQIEVVIGDARLGDTLTQAGADRARAVVAVTGDDAANLSAALETRRRNPSARTVVRLFDQEFARKVQEALHVDAAMGAFTIAAPTFVAAAYYPDVRSAFLLDGRLYIVLDRLADGEWHGKRPSELRAEREVYVLMRRPAHGQTFTADSQDLPLDRSERVLAVVWRPLAHG